MSMHGYMFGGTQFTVQEGIRKAVPLAVPFSTCMVRKNGHARLCHTNLYSIHCSTIDSVEKGLETDRNCRPASPGCTGR